MASDPRDPDREQNAGEFAPAARRAILAETRRFVIVGASGWIGRALFALLHQALGAEGVAARVACFGSQARRIEIEPGLSFDQRPLDELATLAPEPTILFHLAFLTKDKVGAMDDADYARRNRALSQHVLDALAGIGVDRLFVASSGAAAFADDPDAAHDLRLYGGLKREDEDRFACWAEHDDASRRAVITRIFNISGPYINKHQTYALASFILDALAGRAIEVRAPMRVVRGYVAVGELLSAIVLALLAGGDEPVLRFDSGGEAMELGEVAARVAAVIGGVTVDRRPITSMHENRYVGDDARYQHLLRSLGIAPTLLANQIAQTAAFLERAA